MAYSALDRSLHLSVFVYLSEGWTEIADTSIASMNIKQIACSKSVLAMGEFCRNKIELVYIVDSDNPIAWENKKIKIEISEGESEPDSLGIYYISGSEISTKDSGKTYTIVGYDTPDSMNDVYPVTLSSTNVEEIVSAIESHTGMSFSDKSFSLKEIASVPSNTTYGGLLGYIAGFDGKNVRVNRQGELEAYWYDSVKDFTIGREVQLQGEFTDKQNVPPIHSIVSGSGSENTITVGSGKALQYVNPYIDETQLITVLNRINGFTYNIGTVKWRGNPNVQAGDTVKIETQEGRTVNFLIMQNNITYDGGMSVSSSSYSYEQDVTVLGSKSPTERKLEVVYHKLNTALMNATDLMKGGAGGYYKLLTDKQGKPYGFQITDSDPIITTTHGWMFTNNGLFYSTDGFQTVSKVAMTMDGHIIADFVDTGILSDGEGTSGNNWWNLDTGEIHIGNSNVVTKDDGAISSVKTYWLQTKSADVPDTTDSNWSKTPVVFKPGYHIWQMTKTEYINPMQKATYSEPVEITSPDVVSIETYYRLSSSQTKLYEWLYPSDSTFPGDETFPSNKWSAEWHTDFPDWTPDTYVWIRQLLTYTDGSTKWTNPVVDAAFTNVTSLVSSYDTKFEKNDKEIALKANQTTVKSYYDDAIHKIEQEKKDRSSELKTAADQISAKVTSVSNSALRGVNVLFKTSVSKDSADSDGYLYPGDNTYPDDELYPTEPIASDFRWTEKEPTLYAGHYLWSKYHLSYFDEATQKEVTKDIIRLGEAESSAYNMAVNNSAELKVLDDSVGITADRVRKLNDDVYEQSAKFNVAYDKITSSVEQGKKDSETYTNTQIQQSAKEINQSVSDQYSKKAEIIANINNVGQGNVKIKADNVALEGYTTINNNFKIDENGDMYANNGTFSGTINGSEIRGSDLAITNTSGNTYGINEDSIYVTMKDGSFIKITNQGIDVKAVEGNSLFGEPGTLSIGATTSILPKMFSPITWYGGTLDEDYTFPRADGISIFKLKNWSTNPYVEITTLFGGFGITAWPSDKNLKWDIQDTDINNALDLINRIQHRKFKWKNPKDGSLTNSSVELGYVAQEIEKLMPVTFDVEQEDKTTRKQIDQTKLMPYITKAIQELSSKLEKIEKRLEKLEGDQK